VQRAADEDSRFHAPSDQGGAPTLNSATDCLILIDRFRAPRLRPFRSGVGGRHLSVVSNARRER
jgi:hypothetical protein